VSTKPGLFHVMFICTNLLESQVFRQPNLSFAINNELKNVISHQSSVIGDLSLIYLFIISHWLADNRF
jgi:hypothetical protein